MSKRKHRNYTPDSKEENRNSKDNNNTSNNNINNGANNFNPFNNNFDNSPLGQISRMMGNIDINKLAQMLYAFGVQDNNEVNVDDNKNNVENTSTVNERSNVQDKTETKTDEAYNDSSDVVNNDVIIEEFSANKKEKIIQLLKSIGDILDKSERDEIYRIIDIYMNN
ncbi:hypothetical protein ACER0A_008375 [Haloimpatiens sp. FM7315]|uniref:hypothetical protein n=1 Tax=Haloimpatiens sp. FM7315 TaxID=3298609 RepID=UPI00370A353B